MADPKRITIEFPFTSPPAIAGPTWDAVHECLEVLKRHDLSRHQGLNVVYNLGMFVQEQLPDRSTASQLAEGGSAG